jgi:hypothetical protein
MKKGTAMTATTHRYVYAFAEGDKDQTGTSWEARAPGSPR